MRNIHDVERLKEQIRSDYNLSEQYIIGEQELVKSHVYGSLSEEEFITQLKELYEYYS